VQSVKIYDISVKVDLVKFDRISIKLDFIEFGQISVGPDLGEFDKFWSWHIGPNSTRTDSIEL